MDISAATAKNTEDREHRSSMMAWAAPPPAAPYHQNIVEIVRFTHGDELCLSFLFLRLSLVGRINPRRDEFLTSECVFFVCVHALLFL